MRTNFVVTLLIGICCLLCAPQYALAQEAQTEEDAAPQQEEMQQPDMMPGMMRGMMGKRMGMRGRGNAKRHHGMLGMPSMAALMNLDAAQRTAYLSLLTKSQKQFLDLREQLLLNKLALHDVMTAKTFDKAKAAELAEQQAKLAAQRVQNKLNLIIELRAMGLDCETLARLGHYPPRKKAGRQGMRRARMMQKPMMQGNQ